MSSAHAASTTSTTQPGAQVFRIEPSRGPSYVLIVPEAMVVHPDFGLLFSSTLAELIHEAAGVPLVLTPAGVQAA